MEPNVSQGDLPASTLVAALAAHAAGLSVLPAHPIEKRPPLDWKRYQSEQMPAEELRRLVGERLGIVTGFHGVEAIDFDLAGFACSAWKDAVEMRAPGLVGRLSVERTPSGGRHVIYRCSEIAGNTKLTTFRLPADELGEHTVDRLGKPLAYSVTDTPAGRMVAIAAGKPVQAKQRAGRWTVEICPIETRGIGGWLITAPSPGYVVERGSLAALPEITADERNLLIECARGLSDIEPAAEHPEQTHTSDTERPGDRYNRGGDHRSLLERHGWTFDHTEGDNQHWSRPGKDAGTSATWHTGKRVFFAFSSNAGIEPEHPYSLFTLRGALEHGGDLSACARAIASEERPEQVERKSEQVEPAPGIILRSHADRLREREHPPLMLVADMLPIGALGALVALPGAGKTLLGCELARAIAAGDTFAGRAVVGGRVIYACPDSPASTERRMLAITEEVAGRILTVSDMPAMPGSLVDLRAAIVAANASGDLVRLVVVDTWDSARSHSDGGYAGQDGLVESIMGGLRRMAADLALSVVVIHHATRADNGRARGSLVFDARADFIGLVDGDGSTVRLTATKCRDGTRGAIGAWRIVPTEVNGSMVPTLKATELDAPAQGEPAHDDDSKVLRFLATRTGDMSLPRIAKHLGHKGNGQASNIISRLRRLGLVDPKSYALTLAGQARVDAEMAFRDDLETEGERKGVTEGFRDVTEGERKAGKSRASAAEGSMEASLASVPSTHIECGGNGRPRRRVEL